MTKIIEVNKNIQRACCPLVILLLAVLAFIIGVVFIILGPVLYFDEQDDIDDGIDNRLVIDNDQDKLYDDWRNPGEARDPLYQKAFYLYNLTNPRDVLAGQKPLFHQIGPLFYQFVQEKIDVVFSSDDREFASYKLYSRYYYKEEDSVDPITNATISPTTMITTVNPDWMTALALVGTEFSLRSSVIAEFVSNARQFLEEFSEQQLDSTAWTIAPVILGANPSFPDDWRTGNPSVNYTLPVDLSSVISSSLAQDLFDATMENSLVHPTTWVYWRNASNIPMQDSDIATRLLEIQWGINQTTRESITSWFENVWLGVANPDVKQSSQGFPPPQQWPGAQWASLKILSGVPLQTAACLDRCTDPQGLTGDPTGLDWGRTCEENVYTCLEYACWATYQSGIENITVISDTLGTQLLDGTNNHTGFTDADEVAIFLEAVEALQFSAIASRYGLSPSQAVAVHEYFLYILDTTMKASINSDGGYGDTLGTEWEGLFVQRPAEQIIFGKDAPLLGLVDSSIPVAQQRVVLQRNDSSFEEAQQKPQRRVNTGSRNLDDIGRFALYQGNSSVDYWAQPEFFDGTDGTVFPKPTRGGRRQRLFSTALARNVRLKHQGDKKVRGVKTRQFGFTNDTLASAQVNPDNAQYFTEVDGFHNFTTQPQYPSGITGVALFYSRAHNLGVDDSENEKLLYESNDEVVTGLPPEPLDEHDLYYRVEPRTGRTFELRERYQINYHLSPTQLGYYHGGVQNMFFPVFWYDEGYTITERQTDKFERDVKDEDERSYTILWSFLLVGCVLLVGSVLILIADVAYLAYTYRSKIAAFIMPEKTVELEGASTQEDEDDSGDDDDDDESDEDEETFELSS